MSGLIVDALDDEHQDREWSDVYGHRWRWSDIDGWVVDGMATLGGYEPDDHGPFSEVRQ